MIEPDRRKYRSAAAQAAARAAAAAAWVSGLFGVVLAALLVLNHVQVAASAPLQDETLAALRKAVQANPGDAALRERIRAYDLLARRAFFTARSQIRTGGFLLLAAVAIFLASAKTAAELRRRHYLPPKCPGGETPPSSLRRAAAAGGGLLAAAALLLSLASPPADLLSSPPPPPSSTAGAAPAGGGEPGPAQPFCAPEPVPDHAWPQFRGPGGNGTAVHAEAPLRWDGPKGEHILWKTPVPRPGPSSPVVWENRVFLTGADKETCEVFCFDAGSGALLWRKEIRDVPGAPERPPEVMESTGYAAPTPATDGKRVFALFGTGNVAAFTLDGAPVWARHLGVPKNPYGHASSLALFPGRLLVQYDDEKGGRLLALDPATGKILWDQARPVKVSWATPVVANTGSRMEVLLNSKPLLTSHDPMTGRILWSLDHLGDEGEVAPSAAYASGRVFAGTENVSMAAVAVGPPPRLLWKFEDDLPDVSSPAATERFLVMASGGGVITGLEAATGKVLWRRELEEGFHASPVIVGDRAYLTDRKGVTFVFRLADRWEELARNPLGEKVSATPAFPRGRIYVRGEKHLYAIGP